MTGFIPEITTIISVKVDTDAIDDSIDLMNGDPILSSCFGEVIDHLTAKKAELNKVADPVAYAVSENLQSHQSQIISIKHYKTGLMMNSVDITQDGDAQYLVGNTATSIDGFPYPLAIEKGSKSHWVAPKTFDALHWEDKDGEHWSKGHMVSGIKADPFVQPSIDMTNADVESIVDDYINKILD